MNLDEDIHLSCIKIQSNVHTNVFDTWRVMSRPRIGIYISLCFLHTPYQLVSIANCSCKRVQPRASLNREVRNENGRTICPRVKETHLQLDRADELHNSVVNFISHYSCRHRKRSPFVLGIPVFLYSIERFIGCKSACKKMIL